MATENNGKTISLSSCQSHNDTAQPISTNPMLSFQPPPYSELNIESNSIPIACQPLPRFDPGELMEIPIGVQACPPGLEYLISLDQLLVQTYSQSSRGLESNTKFCVKTKTGRNIFRAIENSDYWTKCCLESQRPFDIKVFDIYNVQVIHFHRPIVDVRNCVEVSSPPGHAIGRIVQEFTFCYPQFMVLDNMGNTVLLIEGSASSSSCFRNDEFNVLTLDGTQIGRISKKWTGLSGIFSGSNTFGVSFPMDLDVRKKAVMLGACILIYVQYYGDD